MNVFMVGIMKKKFFVIAMFGIMLFSLVACSKDEGTGSMVVDDVFYLTDRGVVLTGNVESGVICVGDRAVIIRTDGTELETEVVGIEWFEKSLEEAEEGMPIGVFLERIDRDDVNRGDKLVVYGE